MDPNLLVIAGPTASGKTKLGVQLATALDGEIISADSRQVFRGMDIGTGKDLPEYGDIPYHLIAHRVREGGGDETLLVKFKIALHPLTAGDAASFCRAEMVQQKKILACLPLELEGARYECWVSVPPDTFQQFAITADGICEILPAGHPDDPPAEDGGGPCTR